MIQSRLFLLRDNNFIREREKGKGSGVWPSMVTHTRNLSSAFNPSKCTLTAVNTHLEQWGVGGGAESNEIEGKKLKITVN